MKRDKAVPFPSFNLVHTELTICELKQVPSAGTEKEEKVSYFHSATTRDVSRSGSETKTGHTSWTVGWCEFSAEKQVDGKVNAEVTATYLFIFLDPPPPSERLTRNQFGTIF